MAPCWCLSSFLHRLETLPATPGEGRRFQPDGWADVLMGEPLGTCWFHLWLPGVFLALWTASLIQCGIHWNSIPLADNRHKKFWTGRKAIFSECWILQHTNLLCHCVVERYYTSQSRRIHFTLTRSVVKAAPMSKLGSTPCRLHGHFQKLQPSKRLLVIENMYVWNEWHYNPVMYDPNGSKGNHFWWTSMSNFGFHHLSISLAWAPPMDPFVGQGSQHSPANLITFF